MSSKALTLLGFASKAGRLAFGMDAAISALKAKKSYLIVTAEDVSAKSRKEIAFFSEKSGVPLSVIKTDKETLSHAVGKKCGIISVNDKGFANTIKEEICQ